jgi:hypothetical protein
MQGLIKNEFHGNTVIVVSHWPDMIMGFGSIEIGESEDPISLAGLPGVRFRELLRASSK